MMNTLKSRIGLGILMAAAISCFLLAPSAYSSGLETDWDRSGETYLSARTSPFAKKAGPRRSPYLFPKSQNHLFISIQVGERTMEGEDFDGSVFYTSDTELFMVPKLEPASFFGLMVEGREDWMGYQIGYTYAKHEYSWVGIPVADATTHFVDFNFLLYAISKGPIQPFGLLGFSLNGIRMEDGKYNAVSDKFLDSSMYGVGFNYGAGVDYYLGIRVKLTLGIRGHYNSYSSIAGQDLDEGLSATGHQYYMSVGFNTHN